METEHMMCIVLEYVEGGELFDFVQKMHQQLRTTEDGKVDEVKVKKIFLQLLHAVKWLHEHNIVHRDLKLESKCEETKTFTIALLIYSFSLRYSYS